MYLTFIEWLNMGGSNISETAYNQLEYSSRRKIDKYSFDRLVGKTDIPECVKMAMFKIINILLDEQNGQQVETVINDGIHVNFVAQKTADETIKQTINEYLTADLTYRGV